jgi:uncharacterized protein (DUF342 family)
MSVADVPSSGDTTGNVTGPDEKGVPKKPEARRASPKEGQSDAPDARSPKKKGKAGGESRDALDGAFVARVAVYAGGLSAGLGIKPVDMRTLKSAVQDPAQRSSLKAKVLDQLSQALDQAEVTNGVDSAVLPEAAEAFVEAVAQGDDSVVARKVATGDPPEPAESARLEYLLNPDDLPMHEVQDVPETSNRTWLRMVRAGETLVQLIPAKPGKAGRDVKGQPVEPDKPEEVTLASVRGGNTVVQEDKLVAECDGACEENARGVLRVVPEVEVDSVDGSTGSIPEAGISSANILVARAIRADYGVATSENVFVGLGKRAGKVEQTARLSARNLAVKGKVFGPGEGGAGGDRNVLDVQETCVTKGFDRRSVSATRILVEGDVLLSTLEADESIRIDGNMVGGDAVCRKLFTVSGDMGTADGGSRTRLMVPPPGDVSRKGMRLTAALNRQKKALADLQDRQSELADVDAKRSKSDPYWAALSAGDVSRPDSPRQAQTLRQFRDAANLKKKLERSVGEIRQAVERLQEELDTEAEAAEEAEITACVLGRTYLDATFEAAANVEEEALELVVTYTLQGKRYRNHTLKDILEELSKQAKAYLEVHAAQVAERRQAIEQMFKDTGRRPSMPEVKHKRFELPFTWVEPAESEEEAAGPFRVATTGYVDSSEPGTLCVRTIVTPREVLQGVALGLKQEGPKISFTVGNCERSQVKWQAEPATVEVLNGIVVRGITAVAFMAGKEPEAYGEPEVVPDPEEEMAVEPAEPTDVKEPEVGDEPESDGTDRRT